jgi:hypothetical protein
LGKALLDYLAFDILLAWCNYKIAVAAALVVSTCDVDHKLLELLVGHHLVIFFVDIFFKHHYGVWKCLRDIFKKTAFGFVFGNAVQVLIELVEVENIYKRVLEV